MSEERARLPLAVKRDSGRRRMIIGVTAALLGLAALLTWKETLSLWARWMATRQLNVGAISEAQRWLAWAEWSNPRSSETDLMRAVCFRRIGQMSRWDAALTSSREKGARLEQFRQELMLGLIRQGAYEAPKNQLNGTPDDELFLHDLGTVSVRGYLARRDPGKARSILDSWSKAFPHEAQVAYVWGVYWFHQGDETKALTEFNKAVARQPLHELALSSRAMLLEKQDRLAEALKAYVDFVTRCPHRDTAKVGLARVLRKLGCVKEALAVAESIGSSPDQFSDFWAEMGAINLELGDCKAAQRWFAQSPVPDGPDKWKLLMDAARAFALQGETLVADRLFEQANVEENLTFRINELSPHLADATDKKKIAEELQSLSAALKAASAVKDSIPIEQTKIAERERTDMSAADLYALHCSACHGTKGDGNGQAARHQFPRPRDLRNEHFRLVSTDTGNPTSEDLETVIERGMPGTSMKSFENLSENDRRLLADEVSRLRREGIRDRYIDTLKEMEEEVIEEDVQEFVDSYSVPGEVVRVPDIGPADSLMIAKGRDVYRQCGCAPCHGDDGTGDQRIPLFDERQQTSPSRDLVNEPFKGGHEPKSVYLRILLGMPGSPHPATKALTQEQLVDLVHYCRSLSREPKRALTNHERFLEATSRPLVSALAE